MSDYVSKSVLIERIRYNADEGDFSPRERDIAITIIENQPTVDEKEIIRKYGKQIINKMKVLLDLVNTNQRLSVMQAMDIVKEECGIDEN